MPHYENSATGAGVKYQIHKHHFQQLLLDSAASELTTEQTKYVAVKGQSQTLLTQMSNGRLQNYHPALNRSPRNSTPTSPLWDRTTATPMRSSTSKKEALSFKTHTTYFMRSKSLSFKQVKRVASFVDPTVETRLQSKIF